MLQCSYAKNRMLVTLHFEAWHPAPKRKNARGNGGRLIDNRRRVTGLEADRRAGHIADFAAGNAQVVQLAIAHAAEFSNRLTILAPIVERACYVHDDPLS